MNFTDHKLEGIGVRRVTMKKTGTIASTDVGKVCKSGSSAYEVAVGTEDTRLRGLIEQVNSDDITIIEEGWVWLPYTGTAPTALAENKLECGASGLAQVDASNGRVLWVEKVDTTNTKALVFLRVA